MIKITKNEFDKLSFTDNVLMECDFCKKEYYLTKNLARHVYYRNKKYTICSKECHKQYEFYLNRTSCTCLNCNIQFYKMNKEIKKHENSFCSQSCSTTYNNKNKKFGCRRSKIEKWIEDQLTILFPNLEIYYNQKSAIGSELDIYIPSLNLAFELNGIFHYEPIFGVDKLLKTQNNDNNKFQKCYENSINLCIIDISKLSYFKPKNAQKYLDIIVNIIKESG